MIQLKYVGEGQCPTRGEVIDLVLSLGVKVADLLAVYTLGVLANSILALSLGAFSPQLRTSKKKIDPWSRFRLVPLSRQEEVKNITILVRNESLPPEDIATWLGRHGAASGSLEEKLR